MRLIEVHRLSYPVSVLVKRAVIVLLAGIAVFAQGLKVLDCIAAAPSLWNHMVNDESDVVCLSAAPAFDAPTGLEHLETYAFADDVRVRIDDVRPSEKLMTVLLVSPSDRFNSESLM